MDDIQVAFDRLDRVDGSARFAFGDVKAIASVSGPIEVRLAAEQASRATLEVSVKPLCGVPGTESKELAASIHAILSPILVSSQNPRTLIQLTIQALSSQHLPLSHHSSWRQEYPPALKAACINAAMAALLDAGGSVPLRGVVCAVSVPNTQEDVVGDGSECFAFLFGGTGQEQLIWVDHRTSAIGKVPGDYVNKMEQARQGARLVQAALKEAISRKN